MSLRDPNPANKSRPKRVAIVEEDFARQCGLGAWALSVEPTQTSPRVPSDPPTAKALIDAYFVG